MGAEEASGNPFFAHKSPKFKTKSKQIQKLSEPIIFKHRRVDKEIKSKNALSWALLVCIKESIMFTQ